MRVAVVLILIFHTIAFVGLVWSGVERPETARLPDVGARPTCFVQLRFSPRDPAAADRWPGSAPQRGWRGVPSGFLDLPLVDGWTLRNVHRSDLGRDDSVQARQAIGKTYRDLVAEMLETNVVGPMDFLPRSEATALLTTGRLVLAGRRPHGGEEVYFPCPHPYRARIKVLANATQSLILGPRFLDEWSGDVVEKLEAKGLTGTFAVYLRDNGCTFRVQALGGEAPVSALFRVPGRTL